jgi:cytochrome c-type biogenesis protein CcmH
VRRVSCAAALALLVMFGVAAAASAQDAYSERTLHIARQLNCPICAGESVADSQSELARQMRGIIEQKVQAGESDAQIKAYFQARYGDSVLASPPKSGLTLALWWLPVVAVAIGALALVLFLRERVRSRPEDVAPPVRDQELEAIARDVLGADATGTASR